ncbi:hypothetical protein EXU85_14170 [Spirosoma sp. KCTC 42546]|uniref:HipA family kinase n=1 Tax=Spirosoma sp. KCTC 42546 TaxID=2520506 RepID=UPI00115948E4|nr:HipA family kinase [Spirosoma sp. KCTC 42546]QDK79689.1 hypothetical protein EXU85_14170 [Spirosoma sp. KCTC 42546]
MLITDTSYRLPRLTALRYNDTFTTGANQPGLVAARNQQTRQLIDCVVKFRGGERMTPEACARELLAAFIAKEWGIRVVEPVLVDVGDEFVELERGKPHYQLLAKSIGLNVGSVYVPGYDTLPVHQPLSAVELPQAQHIFVFDVFIQNADRRAEKPNLMANGQELVIYDHELAFSFIQALFKNAKPYQLREQDRIWIENLFLLAKIKRFPLPEIAIQEAFGRLDNKFWDKAFELIPPEWRTDQLPEIRSFLTEIVNNSDLFVQSVKPFLV